MSVKEVHFTKLKNHFSKGFKKHLVEYFKEYEHMIHAMRLTVRPDAVGNMLIALTNKTLFLMKQHNNYHKRYLRPIESIHEFFGLTGYPIENWFWMDFQKKLNFGKGIMSQFVMDTRRIGIELNRQVNNEYRYHYLYRFDNNGIVKIYNLNNPMTIRLLEQNRTEDNLVH